MGAVLWLFDIVRVFFIFDWIQLLFFHSRAFCFYKMRNVMSTTSECYLFSFPWALAVILVNIKTVKVADDGILIEL